MRPKAVDDLVGDQQHVVLAQHRLDLLPVGARRHDDAAGAHQRLADEGRNGVGAFAQDRLLELLGKTARERLLALARFAEAPMMRAGDVEEVRRAAGRSRGGSTAGPVRLAEAMVMP